MANRNHMWLTLSHSIQRYASLWSVSVCVCMCVCVCVCVCVCACVCVCGGGGVIANSRSRGRAGSWLDFNLYLSREQLC